VDQGPSRRQPERRRLSALSPAGHRRRQVDGNIERRGSRALPSGLLRCVARRAGSSGAAGAGARGLNHSEAIGRDVCASRRCLWGPVPPAAAVGRASAQFGQCQRASSGKRYPGSAPCHLGLGIRRAVLVDVAAAGLGFHVDIRVHRVFARYARTDFQHPRVHRAAVL
jgi:hypothetical protein